MSKLLQRKEEKDRINSLLDIIDDYRNQVEVLKKERAQLKNEIAKRDNLLNYYRQGSVQSDNQSK